MNVTFRPGHDRADSSTWQCSHKPAGCFQIILGVSLEKKTSESYSVRSDLLFLVFLNVELYLNCTETWPFVSVIHSSCYTSVALLQTVPLTSELSSLFTSSFLFQTRMCRNPPSISNLYIHLHLSDFKKWSSCSIWAHFLCVLSGKC